MPENKKNMLQTFDYNVIYVYTSPYEQHEGRVKIGEATLHLDKFDFIASAEEMQKKIEQAARNRINQYTLTADIEYVLLHAELAIRADTKTVFHDSDVHNVLLRSGFEKKALRQGAREWFVASKEKAVEAIEAVKQGKNAISGYAAHDALLPEIHFRESQQAAIDKTVSHFRANRKNFLWNAKMRFGKTVAAMQVAKSMCFNKTLIITHRPAVADGWFTDFGKLFKGTDWKFGSKPKGETIDNLLNQTAPFIYFASIQDLRLSRTVVENSKSQAEGFDKNLEIFNTEWDFLIIDEAHEGTQSALGKVLNDSIDRRFTLYLSGTPFNLLEKRESDEVFTWDYVMEQEAKQNWDKDPLHDGEPNPYATMPRLSMFTYELNKYIRQPDFEEVEDKAFNFREFFRVDDEGKFVYKKSINDFLDLLTTESDSQFPYSTQQYRSYIRHTLWMLPGVKEAKALCELLREHPVFGAFGIANVAGNEELTANDALKTVKDTINQNDYSITLTCGKLTTGVNVPQWTAVFMLSNITSATAYLQTAFRCQTPYSADEQMKTQCYVFDFAPDRTLQIVAEAAELRTRAGETNRSEQRDYMSRFLNFCPIISATNGAMKAFDVDSMLKELKKAVIQRVVRNGFDDVKMYNDNLMKLNDIDLSNFADLRDIIGRSNQTKKIEKFKVNAQGFDEEELETGRQAEKKPPTARTPEEAQAIEKLKQARKLKHIAISILRGISIRIPMLIYGAKVSIDEKITPERMMQLIDDASWEEFMPKGVTKVMASKFLKYYDEDVFVGAGLNIRRKALASDSLFPFERIEMLAEIFGTFKNPDKETVLTPWRVVNLHLSSTLGGNDFNTKTEYGLPEWKEPHIWGQEGLKVLEINSKSGLYPLLAAYNCYCCRLEKKGVARNSAGERAVYDEVWQSVLDENIFVLCKSPMAKTITERTLAGYRPLKTNVVYIDSLVPKLKHEKPYQNYVLQAELMNKFKIQYMKFDVVIGNPPYMSGNKYQVYTDFVVAAKQLGKICCLIFPSGWQKAKTANGLSKLNNAEYKRDKTIVKIDNYLENSDSPIRIFPDVSTGPVNIVLWNAETDNELDGAVPYFEYGKFKENRYLPIDREENIKDSTVKLLLNYVKIEPAKSIAIMATSQRPYGLRTYVFTEPQRYNLDLQESYFEGSVRLFGGNRTIKFIEKSKLPQQTKNIDKWKLFVPAAWGNMDAKSGVGGAYSNIIIAKPLDVCSETYIEFGSFENKEQTHKAAKYFMTTFFRALLYLKKDSQMAAKDKYEYIPLQDFAEGFWEMSIAEIDARLYDKYAIPADVRDYCMQNIQQKTDADIDFFE